MPEKRVVLQNCGVIDPRRIATYVARDGFAALKKARGMPPADVIKELKAAGLRGRGGAGFPCGMKWEMAASAPGDEKFVIANADEGEVGTFKDRYILQNDPFTLIEGLAIAAHATGAGRGYIYLRGEYHFLLEPLQDAIDQSKKAGMLEHVVVEVREGAGAYVCGEESALMDSIEGGRGEVRYRPPFPPTSGLWQKPTIINNVETLMNVPRIVLNGAAWFQQMGTERSKGTKVFSVAGDVGRPGVYEMVLGSPLRELVMDLAQAKAVKMVQVGGATGRVLPAAMLDTPLAYETILGAGAVTVLNESRDAVDAAYRSLEFLADESCGKCTPCREGTEVMAEILGRFVHGEGSAADIGLLQELAGVMSVSAMCGLGQAAPVPVMDTLQHFRGDYEKGIKQIKVGK